LFRRTLFASLFVLSAAPVASATDVLIIYDTTGGSTPSLKTALEGAGYTVDLSAVAEDSWNGTNPSPSSYDAVIHLNGSTYSTEMPSAGQSALLNYVQGGGGFIHGEWNAYQIDDAGQMTAMTPITLLERTSGDNGTRTYTLSTSHPVVANVSSSFSLAPAGYNIGSARSFSTDPSTVLATDEDGNDAIVVRSYGSGRVVGLSNAGNWNGYSILADTNMQQVYIDAVDWVAGCDSDGDGYTSTDCGGTDCDDDDASINPAASETCDGVDNDCDSTVDEDDATDVLTWYADLDSDGYGDASSTDLDCYQPSNYVSDNTDCDDADADTYPGADEYCDGHDDNCDGDIDEDTSIDVSTWYADTDADGAGDAAVSDIDCYQPSGYVENSSDCDDTTAVLNTSDVDADGYTSCDSDCNDTDADINIDAAEIWYDGVDQNCDEGSDYDQDGDSFDHLDYDADGDGVFGTDCDDLNPDINTDATEIWYDGTDQNCDALSDYDADLDGQDSESYGGLDCDDADADTYTGAPDTPYDGIITDCANADDNDADGDGFPAIDYGGTDCDDANSDVYPGAEEIWYDGIDQDCDENDDDQDEDGYALADDCDDTNADLAEDCSGDTGDTGDTGDDKEGGCFSSTTGARPAGLWALLFGAVLLFQRKRNHSA
jgi:hypothetical protein